MGTASVTDWDTPRDGGKRAELLDSENALAGTNRDKPGHDEGGSAVLLSLTEGELSMAYEFILTDRFDGVAVITLNRPDKLNALSFPLVRELDEALTQCEADDDIKAVILTGAGDRAFSAGADIHEMAGLTAEELASAAMPPGTSRPLPSH